MPPVIAPPVLRDDPARAIGCATGCAIGCAIGRETGGDMDGNGSFRSGPVRSGRLALAGAAAMAVLLLGAPPAWAVPDAKSVERCEADAHGALQRIHGKALAAVRFDGAPRGASGAAADDGVLRGSGRYTLAGQAAAAGTAFQYSCALGAGSGEPAGVVVRDAAAAARTAAAAERAWDPDLSKVSPRECESTTAALLMDRHPRATLISFDAGTLRLEPAPDDRIGLEGRGALRRAPGMAAAPFGYRCEFDSRNGRIVSATTRP